jgi:hydroxyethylthiazole kinase-like uncharacterized protein yjeF
MHPLPHADHAVRTEHPVITPALLRAWPLPLDEDGDKHSRGTVLIIGGSTQTPGAMLLSGLGALRAGAGRLQLATTADASTALALHVPEAFVQPLDTTDGGGIEPAAAIEALADRIPLADVVLIGPGLSTADAKLVRPLLDGALALVNDEAIVVLDALALASLPDVAPIVVRRLHGRLVLTPNRDEVRQLVPDLADGDDTEHGAVRAARRFGAVVSTQGFVCAADGRCWEHSTGGVGLGTSGSGDVLSGLVAGVAARGGDAAQAACWGAHLHGAAGDRLTARLGRVGFLARELLIEAPVVLSELSGS